MEGGDMLKIRITEGQLVKLEKGWDLQDHPDEQEMTIVYEKANIHPLYPCCGCALENMPNLCTMMICHIGYQYHEKKEK